MQSTLTVPIMPPHIRAIDGLRGVAILLVLIHHFGMFEPGWAGVDIFFVISGFLITRILLWTKNSPRYFSHFYARRALRILPLYYFSILLFFCVILPIAARSGSLPHYGMRDFLWYLFHLSNWWVGSGHMASSPISHFWSLAIEEQFYFVWPLMVLLLSKRNLTKVTMAIAVFSFSCRVFDAAAHPYGIGFNFYTPFRIEPIAVGSLAATLADDQVLWAKLGSCRKTIFWSAFIVWITTIFLGDNRLICVFGISAIGLVALTMLIEAVEGVSPFDRPFFRHLGKYSYALYVVHYPVFLLASYIFQSCGRYWNPVLTGVIGVPVSYLLARASWVLIESPFLKLKNRFEYKVSARQDLKTVGAAARR